MESHPLALILLLAMIAIAIVLLVKLSGVWRSNANTYDCSSEVRAHAAILKSTKDLANPASIRCPTNVIRAQGEETARTAIAAEMLRCWNQWGRGELPLFGDTTGTYCHVCGMVYVDGTSQVTGLQEYLATTKVPRSEQTYLADMMAVEQGDLFDPAEAFQTVEDVPLSTGAPIGVIYRYTKDAQTGQLVQNWVAHPTRSLPGGLGAGAALGVAAVYGGASLATGGTLLIAGGIVGGIAGFEGTEPLDTIASVHVRELDPAGLASLGCDYAPVES